MCGIGPTSADIGGLLGGALVMDGEDPQAPTWTAPELAPDRRLSVAIVGTGFTGLMAALRMKQAGVPFVIFEKGTEVGGTWWENTYPDCRTDVHSHIYTYSFFPFDWPSYFGRQRVIMEYLRTFARENGLYEHIRFGTTVLDAAWQDDEQKWVVRTAEDAQEQIGVFDILVSAVGQLNRPSIPHIPGAQTFTGPAFHSAEWDHSVDLTGKRVAVVGTGASALQFAPATARIAEHVTIFQRTAPWLMPTPELRQDVGEDERWLMRELPLYRAYYRFSIFLPRAIGQLDVATVDPDYPPTERAISAKSEQLRQILTNSLLSQLDPDDPLVEHVIPDYPPGAKRIIRDDGTWIKTLKRDNVRVVSDGIERIDETGVWTRSGEHIPVDAILYGTGFSASDFLMPMTVTGVGGRDLHEFWDGDARAFFGITIPGFPNLFCLYGPNTGLVLHGNVVFFMECQANYLTEAIRLLLQSGSQSMDLRSDVFEEHSRIVDEANRLRAWGWSGVHSWYKNAKGRSPIMWPLPAQDYYDATRAPDPAHYRLSPVAASASTPLLSRSVS
jgi:4-hydroxyacetophenone monooxygenase